jgi:hypothetical protein
MLYPGLVPYFSSLPLYYLTSGEDPRSLVDQTRAKSFRIVSFETVEQELDEFKVL